MSKLLTGSGKSGGGGDSQEFMGSDAAAVAEAVKARSSFTGGAGGKGAGEVLAAVSRGELSREAGEARLRELLSGDVRARRGHLVSIPGHTDELVKQAREMIERRLALEAPRADDSTAVLEKYQIFLRCKRGGGPQRPLHHGIYLLLDPRGRVVGPEDWISAYKPNPKDFWRGEIICQECLQAGISERLPYEWQDYSQATFIPNLRHVFRVAKDYRQYELEREVRLAELPYEAQNIERNAINKLVDAMGGHETAKEAMSRG